MNTRLLPFAALAAALLAPATAPAALPDAIPYQGRVAVKSVNFSGAGEFKFAVYEHATGGFAPASATAVLTGQFVTSVSIDAGGSGYSNSITVAVVGGGGSGAQATATVTGGVITAINVTAAGTGYTTTPAVVITDANGPAQLWNNTAGATTAALAEPSKAVSLPVTNGLYALGLGDTTLSNMAALPASLAPAAGKRAFVRVWFDDGSHGFQALTPDLELRSVPFAREAANTASVGGVSLENLARRDTANTFTHLDGLTVTGTGPSVSAPAPGATVPLTGPGTRMEFLPGYGALRAGTVTGTQWDAANIGLHSTAMGHNTIASGSYSTAMGTSTTASGTYSTAMGTITTASGHYSTAMGTSTTASDFYSTAMGASTTASGRYSTAMGATTTAVSGYETVLGRFNTAYTPADTTSWAAADRLFVIGNGTAEAARSDALVMLKSGTTTLNGTLRINHRDGLTITGPGPSDGPNPTPVPGATVPVTGAGTRMEFLPGYSAFRAGTVTGTQWDAANIGTFSTAIGLSTTASGTYSTALGYNTTASGGASTAIGGSTTASGNSSTALGVSTTASGTASTAMGAVTTASGTYSTAMGYSTNASGNYSTVMGSNTTAASGYETVLGRYNTAYTPTSTNGWNTSDRLFVIGNGTGSTARSDAFVILKNGNGSFPGVLTHGSDRNRKTAIVPADTAAILAQLASLPIATWRFKDDPATHLGPMAQDFRAAFQLGDTDTGIASVDADGVALAAIQELAKQNTVLRSEVDALKARLAAIEAKLK